MKQIQEIRNGAEGVVILCSLTNDGVDGRISDGQVACTYVTSVVKAG